MYLKLQPTYLFPFRKLIISYIQLNDIRALVGQHAGVAGAVDVAVIQHQQSGHAEPRRSLRDEYGHRQIVYARIYFSLRAVLPLQSF